ncbi:MAG: CCA tRNA nucleotidyltransferase [Paracoccaceae bacterium]
MTRIEQPWLKAPETQRVCTALQQADAQVLFVGGCVRNALLGVEVSDLDLATDTSPQNVMDLAKKASIKAIPTGIEHGTVTLVSGGVPYEVTTFRKDVATDGRRAVVAFSTDISEDAARRDFTMNAIYARPDGEIVDPLGGLDDLHARRVRFIGDANARIREDYLRSLRYFRFHAWYGDASQGLDPEALAAISENLDGLKGLSRERVGAEILKLLGAPDPAPSIAGMRQTGVLNVILPGADDRTLGLLVHVEGEYPPNALRRLALLGGENTAERLRLSRQLAGSLHFLREEAAGPRQAFELAYRHGAQLARDAIFVRAALFEQPVSPDLEAELQLGEGAIYPISAADLMPDLRGPQLGETLRNLESKWIASQFRLNRDELLGSLK